MTALPHIEAPQGERPIELVELEVDTRISGLFAETTQRMVFANPNPRVLEGSLVFPLPDGAVVTGYALDVEGRMVDGVVVAKKEARRILDAEIRKGVDPGLVEQVAGNLYRTRIYPLPPRGQRIVQLTYVSELSVDGASAAYRLPLGHSETVSEVPVLLEVHSPVVPECQTALERSPDGWVGQARLRGGEDLFVRLPNLPDCFGLVEEAEDGEAFFCLSLRVPEQAAAPFQPGSLGVVWDASGSRGDCSAEITLLRRLASRWPLTPARVQVVRDRAEEPRDFADLGGLADYLEGQPADGATALAGLQFPATVDAWMVFTDGLDTVSPRAPQPGPRPVFTVSSQTASNHAWLTYLAESSGAAYLNLARTSCERAAELLATGAWADFRPVWEGGLDVHVVRAHGRLQLLGRLGEGPVTLRLPDGSGLQVDRSMAYPGRLLARAWAGRECGRLSVEAGSEEAMLALGRRYRLVTPGSSLLVLESLEQYLEYDLEPPESLPALRSAFAARRRKRAEDEQGALRSRLDEVARLWAARVEWWQRDFRPEWERLRQEQEAARPRPSAPGPAAMGSMLGAVGGVPGGGDPFAMAPPSPMIPSPAMAAPMMDMLCQEPAPELEMCREEAAPTERRRMEGGGGEMLKKKGGPEGPAPASIRIRAWDPATPYMDALRTAPNPYAEYLEQREEYANSPSFYLDCGDFLLKAGRLEEGLRVLSNLSELALEDPAVMRMHAWRLQSAGRLDEAVEILERVLQLRPDEPQSSRDLGLALGARFQERSQSADAERAVDLLYAVACRVWDRFPEIELIALMELNRLLELCSRRGLNLDARIDARLRKTLDLDVRISMSWDADLTDVDLHVHEPTGEHAYYGHQNTRIGGLVSRDIRDGYGPEEYVLRRAFAGNYKVLARYFGSHQQTLTGACTVIVNVFTNFARPEEACQTMMLRLDRPSDEVEVGSVTLEAATG